MPEDEVKPEDDSTPNPTREGSITSVTEPAQDSTISQAQVPVQEPVIVPDPGSQVPLEAGAPEPVAVPELIESQDVNPTEQETPIQDVETQDVETREPRLVSLPGVVDNKTDAPSKIEEKSVEPQAKPRIDTEVSEGSGTGVVEKIVEVQKLVTEAEKDQIYQQKLQEGLVHANQAKHAEYEKHLREIVDFIRARATLVTNQEIEEGLKMPDSTVTFRLGELIVRGVVVRIGEGFRAKYRLKEAA